MARQKMTPRKNIVPVITAHEGARRFRSYNRDWSITFGEFLARYFPLWEGAKDYVTDYEASEGLVNQVPRNWRVWAETQMAELVFADSVTNALRCHFPKLVQRLFDQWIMHRKPPESPILSNSVSHRSVWEHVCSNRENVRASQQGSRDQEAGPSTKIVLRRAVSSDDVVEVPVIREIARKAAHDSGSCDPAQRACGKRRQRVHRCGEGEDTYEDPE